VKNRIVLRAVGLGGLLTVVCLIALTAYLLNSRARQPNTAVDEQHLATARLLVTSVMAKVHRDDGHEKPLDVPSDETLKYEYRILKPNAQGHEDRPGDSYDRALLEAFTADRQKTEECRSTQSAFHYYGAIRASKTCLSCHPRPGEKGELGAFGENDLMAVVRITIPSP
jgi:hypothetical protein